MSDPAVPTAEGIGLPYLRATSSTSLPTAMKFGVVTFPGSNCDEDMIHVLEGHRTTGGALCGTRTTI
jgi:hypothetical protein